MVASVVNNLENNCLKQEIYGVKNQKIWATNAGEIPFPLPVMDLDLKLIDGNAGRIAQLEKKTNSSNNNSLIKHKIFPKKAFATYKMQIIT